MGLEGDTKIDNPSGGSLQTLKPGSEFCASFERQGRTTIGVSFFGLFPPEARPIVLFVRIVRHSIVPAQKADSSQDLSPRLHDG